MSNVQEFTIKIDVPSGYKIVDFRSVSLGDIYLDGNLANVWSFVSTSTEKYLILEKIFDWPSWLKCKYIAKDNDGIWYGYFGKPKYEAAFGWSCSRSGNPDYFVISDPSNSSQYLNIYLPDVEAKDSLLENPNFKGVDSEQE